MVSQVSFRDEHRSVGARCLCAEYAHVARLDAGLVNGEGLWQYNRALCAAEPVSIRVVYSREKHVHTGSLLPVWQGFE